MVQVGVEPPAPAPSRPRCPCPPIKPRATPYLELRNGSLEGESAGEIAGGATTAAAMTTTTTTTASATATATTTTASPFTRLQCFYLLDCSASTRLLMSTSCCAMARSARNVRSEAEDDMTWVVRMK